MNLAALLDIADRLERLVPSHRDPHRFHEEKSELVDELGRLAANDNKMVVLDNYHHMRRTA
ncbi:hypothetical protein [Rhizobium ruizarguesonis]